MQVTPEHYNGFRKQRIDIDERCLLISVNEEAGTPRAAPVLITQQSGNVHKQQAAQYNLLRHQPGIHGEARLSYRA